MKKGARRQELPILTVLFAASAAHLGVVVQGLLPIDFRRSSFESQRHIKVRSLRRSPSNQEPNPRRSSPSHLFATSLNSFAPSAVTSADTVLDTMEDPDPHASVAFSHVHLYADRVEDLTVYKALELELNNFSEARAVCTSTLTLDEQRELWQSMTNQRSPEAFVPHGRDVVKQLIAGLGFRVTAARYSSKSRSVLVTSQDLSGVQILVTAVAEPEGEGEEVVEEEKETSYIFDSERIRSFFSAHASRPGIAVLGFVTDSIQQIHDRYQQLHQSLVAHYDDTTHHVLEVFAYYQQDSKEADPGTILRFLQKKGDSPGDEPLPLPGLLVPVPAVFEANAAPAYCDHWVSNVWSRTEFLDTLKDTLGFVPKVDFNAGVVAAGEAQIESTVTGNDSTFTTTSLNVALKDQSQVYLPINNALSQVGHVHGFLTELGQGIQHLASRVENLVDFVQEANDRRQVFGEGFTFLRIPRSYYGVLTPTLLTHHPEIDDPHLISFGCAEAIFKVLRNHDIVTSDGAVALELDPPHLHSLLLEHLEPHHVDEYMPSQDAVLSVIGRSRYRNLHALLRDNLSEETYLGIVRNQILVDIQGDDLLYQIFTSNILQRQPGDEAPFFEFIQRFCSECTDENGCPQKIRPGCGGFGIRNFLTLFLSIEVSKAMEEVTRAREAGDAELEEYAQTMVDYFTSQLSESNPILTEISDAMTLEGLCKEQVQLLSKSDPKRALDWKAKMDEAADRKLRGNQRLMECSAKYNVLMKTLRESRNERLAAK